MFESLPCEDCGGRGIDPGSLHEPEPCPACQGYGKQLVELDTRSSHYATRRPLGRAGSIVEISEYSPTAGELAEAGFRRGE